MNVVYHLIELIVILAVVLIFCGSMLLRIAFKGHKVKQDFDYRPSVTVLMSCFNEGRAVYDTIRFITESDYPEGKLHVIAIDDHSGDDSWKWMQRAARKFKGVQVYKNEKNLGKAHSLLKAFTLSSSELILIVDSDGEIHKRAVLELATSFADDKVGGVGGCVMVRNSKRNWLTQMQTLQYNSVFQLAKIGETFIGSVNCISGAIFMLRSSIYASIYSDIENRKWLGKEVKEGEDRFMTNLILHKGYKTIVNNRAKVYTDVPHTFRQFFSQQLRWRRGFCRTLLWSLEPDTLYKNIKNTNVLAFFRLYFLLMLAFIMPALVSWLLIAGSLDQIIFMKLQLLILFTVVHATNYIISLKIGNRIYIGMSAFIFLPMWMLIDLTLITALALFTLTSISWETRAIK